MYEFFNQVPKQTFGSWVVPEWRYVRDGLHAELAKLEPHYRNTATPLHNSHTLVKILLTLNTPMLANRLRMADLVRQEVNSKLSNYGLISSITKGRVPDQPQFYNNNVTEFIIYDDSDFDEDDTVVNWESAEPIRVLHHPFNDVTLQIPNGKYMANNVQGFAVISVNIAMLLLQYRAWQEWYVSQGLPLQTCHYFLSRYPVFNMVKSHTDIVIRNRACDLFNKRPLAAFSRVHPVAINDYSSTIDRSLSTIMGYLDRGTYEFGKIVEIMPAIFKHNQAQVLPLPDIAPTRYVRWLMDLTRAPLLNFLIQYNQSKPNYRNLEDLIQVRRRLIEIRNDREIGILLNQSTSRDLDQLVVALNAIS